MCQEDFLLFAMFQFLKIYEDSFQALAPARPLCYAQDTK